MRFCVGLFSLSLAVILLLLPACNPEDGQQSEEFTVTVRIPREPDVLNTVRARNFYATPINNLITLPLAEFDPYDLQLKPILAESLGDAEEIVDGEYAGGEAYEFRIRDEAVWDNGEPITGYDYDFTLKAAMNPEVDAPAWQAYLSFIKQVTVDPDDPKKFRVIVAEPYMLAQTITCNFNILPRYFYDPEGLLDPYSLEDFNDLSESGESGDQPALVEFAQKFASPEFNRDTTVGSGAYFFDEWVSNQHIIIRKKEGWWGESIPEVQEMFRANPDQIVYRIIPDEAAAIASLKEGSCDIGVGLSATAFNQMKKDPQWQEVFGFYTPVLFQYRYLEINNRHEILKEKAVRQAIAHVIDYEAIIENIEHGEGERTVGPFSPSKDYYNKALELIDYDVEEARQILTDAGWEDTNNNGTVDKVIDGSRRELELEILTTQSPMGQQVALIAKEGAAQVGINIDVVTQDASSWRQAIVQRNFDMLPMQVRSSPAPNDPFQGWHSSSDQPGGDNRSGFRNAEADSIIQLIRSAENPDERKEHYLELQEVIYEEQPVIFLYIPVERIIADKRLQLTPSSRRPGYFVNQIRSSDS